MIRTSAENVKHSKDLYCWMLDMWFGMKFERLWQGTSQYKRKKVNLQGTETDSQTHRRTDQSTVRGSRKHTHIQND